MDQPVPAVPADSIGITNRRGLIRELRVVQRRERLPMGSLVFSKRKR